MTGTVSGDTSDDHALLDELNQLGRELGPFTGAILTNTLSVSEQLEFGYRLIWLAGRIRARVERPDTAKPKPELCEPGVSGGGALGATDGEHSGFEGEASPAVDVDAW